MLNNILVRREAEQKIQELATKYPVLLITGPRQSGKTTLVKTLFAGYQYYNLESLDIRTFAKEDPRKLVVGNE